MAQDQRIGPILAIDCGTVLTKAILLDQVDGSYHFVARGVATTTASSPWNDVTLGIQHAIQQVEDITGRVLLDEAGYLILPQRGPVQGVDACVAVSSASPPLRAVLAGLVPELSLASAQRAIGSTCTVVEDILVQAPHRRLSEEEQVRRLLRHRPDVVCIVGGADNGATTPVLELVETVATGLFHASGGERPLVLFLREMRPGVRRWRTSSAARWRSAPWITFVRPWTWRTRWGSGRNWTGYIGSDAC